MSDPQFALQCAIVDIQSQIGQTVTSVQYELTRPFMMVRPSLSKDGDHWCFLFGENLQEGVAGFGKTPAEAASEFDKAWWNESITVVPRAGVVRRNVAPDAIAAMETVVRLLDRSVEIEDTPEGFESYMLDDLKAALSALRGL